MKKEELLRRIDDINLQFQKELDLVFKELTPDRPATMKELKDSVMILWSNTVQMVKTVVYDQ